MKETRMAKVFELRIRNSWNEAYQVVTTVSDFATIDIVCRMFGIRRDAIIDYKETNVMPLDFALEYSRCRKAAMGFPTAKAIPSHVIPSLIHGPLTAMNYVATKESIGLRDRFIVQSSGYNTSTRLRETKNINGSGQAYKPQKGHYND